MKKLGAILYTIFALLFAGLPIYVIRMSLQAAGRYEDFTLWPFWALALCAVAVCLIPAELPKIPEWLAVPLWGCGAFQWRYHCFHGIEKYMVMKYDFASALDSAAGIKQAKEAIFTHWAFYPRILEWWNAQCKQDYLYHNSVHFNMITGALTVVLVYLIARRIWKRQRAAMLAAAIVCFWPSLSYYCAVITNEHMAMLGILLTSFLGILTWQLREKRWACAVLGVLTGLSAGATDLFKQFSPVFLIAAFGTGLLFLLMDYKQQSGETRTETARRKRGLGRQILSLLLAVAVMFCVGTAVKERAYRWLEGYLELPVARSATGHFLWIGLNSTGQGMWTEAEGMKVYELAEQYGNDYDKVMDELMDLLKADLMAHRDQLPKTLQNKMEEDWAADFAVSLWVKALYDEEQAIRDLCDDAGEPMPNFIPREELDLHDFDVGLKTTKASGALYVCVMGLVALGGLLAIFLRNPAETYLRLVFYGYALLLLLSEAQGRYQVVLFPVFALLAAGGAEVAGTAPWMLRRKGKQADHDGNVPERHN